MMTVISNVPGGDNGGAGGEVETDPTKTVVSRDAYEKAVTQKKNLSKALSDVNAQLAELQRQQTERDEAEAVKRGEFDKTISKYKEENETLKKSAEAVKNSLVNRSKMDAFKSVFKDIPSQYERLVDLSAIEADADGNVDKETLLKYADTFKKSYPEIISKTVDVHTPNPQGGGGNIATGKMTYAQWLALDLPVKEKLAKMKDVIDEK